MKVGDKIICVKESLDFNYNKIYRIVNVFKSLSHGQLYINKIEISDDVFCYYITPMVFYEKFNTLKNIRKQKLNIINGKN